MWKTIQLALQTRSLPLSQYENVLDDVLHCIRSLLCVSTNSTPHERCFNFKRRSCSGKSLPTWLTCNNKAFVKRFVRNSKSDPYVDKIELIHVNPTYASIRYPNGREATVSVRGLLPCPRVNKNSTVESDQDVSVCDVSQCPHASNDVITGDNFDVSVNSNRDLIDSSFSETLHDKSVNPEVNNVRWSARSNKGVPPSRYGINERFFRKEKWTKNLMTPVIILYVTRWRASSAYFWSCAARRFCVQFTDRLRNCDFECNVNDCSAHLRLQPFGQELLYDAWR